MITLFFSMGQGENHVSYSSINAIRENLSKYHKIDIQRRWIFYCLAWLIEEGYIRRKKRYRQDHNGLIAQVPSILWFTLKGVVWLVRMGVSGAKKVYKSMTTYLGKRDGRSPTKKEFDDGSYWPEDPDQRAALENLLGIATKKIS